MIEANRKITGTVFAAADAVLRRRAGYSDFRDGHLSKQSWGALIEGAAHELLAIGLPESDLKFMKRLPPNAVSCADEIMADLRRRQFLTALYQPDAEGATRPSYRHGSFGTYIYPEEGLLLRKIAATLRPQRAIFLGSYYGYWAHFAIPSIVGHGGRVVLVDPDPDVSEVARDNVESMGVSSSVDVVAARGEDYLRDTSEQYDLVVIDAELPRDHAIAEMRGKGVYRSLLEASLPRLEQQCILVCHNILLNDATGDPSFDPLIARNLEELGPFLALTHEHFDFVEYQTTEGVGVGRRRKSPARTS